MTAVLVLDGVLRRDRSTNTILREGLRLYHGLAASGHLVLLCGGDEDRADWFLRTNGLTQHSMLLSEDVAASPTPEGRRMHQIRRIRATGANVEFVVEPNPEIGAALLREGIPVLVYSHPSYTLPSFRPDYRDEATPWKTLTQEVEYQLEMRAKHTYQDLDPLS